MTYTLENWSITLCPRNPYLAPELRRACLQGQRDSEEGYVITSPILGKTPDNHIQTHNSIYILGTVDPAYEAQFPGARNRLLSTLPLIEEA